MCFIPLPVISGGVTLARRMCYEDKSSKESELKIQPSQVVTKIPEKDHL